MNLENVDWQLVEVALQVVSIIVTIVIARIANDVRGEAQKLEDLIIVSNAERSVENIDKTQYYHDLSQDSKEAKEDTAEGGGGDSDPNNSDEAREVVRGIKKEIQRASRDVADGRRRRKYSGLSKRDYRVWVELLEGDGVFDEEFAADAIEALTWWESYSRNRNPVPHDLVEKLQDILRRLRRRR